MRSNQKHRNEPFGLIVFPKAMATPAPPHPEQPRPPEAESSPRFNPQRHGTFAQWAAVVIAILAFVLGLQNWSLSKTYHEEATAAKTSDEHVTRIAEATLNPALDKVNEKIDAKLKSIDEQLQKLNQSLGQIQGRLGIFVSDQQKMNLRLDQQKSLANLLGPDRILRTIRAELQVARANKEPLPLTDLIDYKNDVQAIPASGLEYWETVAAIINYQSFLNELNGKAPNPNNVSHPCAGLTAGTGQYNLIQGGVIRNCVVDLDTTHDLIENLTIRDSVVRYHGGPVEMRDVAFVNCFFVLDLVKSPSPKKPAHPEVLLALLDSNQQQVRLSTNPPKPNTN